MNGVATDDTLDRPPSRRFTILFTLAMLIIAVGYAAVWRIKTERVVVQAPPTVAVIGARAHTGHDEEAVRAQLTRALEDVRGLDVVGVAHLPTGTRAAALGAGAKQVLAPELQAGGGNRLRLVVQRRDAKTDSLLYEYRVQGATVDEVVHRMAVQIAMSLGLPLPGAGATSPDTEPQ